MNRPCAALISAATLVACAASAPPGQPTLLPETTPNPTISETLPTGPQPTAGIAALPTAPPQTPMSIVFGSSRGEGTGIFFASSDGSLVKRLPVQGTLSAWPDAAPDGRRIVYAVLQGSRAQVSTGLYITDITTGQTTQILAGDGLHPRWSPEATLIAFTCEQGTDICTIRPDGSDQTNLTAQADTVEMAPSWTPDNRIVFMSDRDMPAGVTRGAEIYVMQADGSSIARLTYDNGAYNAFPTVATNGARIAFESDREVIAGSEIYTMALDGSDIRRVTEDDVWNQVPAWSPDGSRILYAADSGSGHLDLFTLAIESGEVTRLTRLSSEDGGVRWGHAFLRAPAAVAEPIREQDQLDFVEPPAGSQPGTDAVLFAAHELGCPTCLQTGIYRVDAVEGSLLRLSVEGLYPVWSPDFRRIGYVRDGELFIANADGSSPTPITDAAMGLGPLAWNTTGLITAECTPFGQRDVCIIDPETGQISNLTPAFSPDSGIRAPGWADSQIIAGNR
ncbi:MAG: TolB family protein, partial [Anaerolineae bacterium]